MAHSKYAVTLAGSHPALPLRAGAPAWRHQRDSFAAPLRQGERLLASGPGWLLVTQVVTCMSSTRDLREIYAATPRLRGIRTASGAREAS